jgi:hypothetical protein
MQMISETISNNFICENKRILKDMFSFKSGFHKIYAVLEKQ